MKTSKIIGCFIGITWLFLLVWNAYGYLSKTDLIIMPKGVQLILGLLLCVSGAALIKKSKNKITTLGETFGKYP